MTGIGSLGALEESVATAVEVLASLAFVAGSGNVETETEGELDGRVIGWAFGAVLGTG
jgi:hypothetical protein